MEFFGYIFRLAYWVSAIIVQTSDLQDHTQTR